MNALGEFLRARRELVTPSEVGISVAGPRRVRGLRREEVAVLAGISCEYYVRLERGRDRAPSLQVISALAGALQLDEESVEYVSALAGRARPPAALNDDKVSPGLVFLLSAIKAPAIVFNRYGDVLASNAAAKLLSPSMLPGMNRLRWTMLDPSAAEQDPDWQRSTAAAVAHLRAQTRSSPDDPRLQALVGELSVKSDRFRELWARHDVHTLSSSTLKLRHPRYGELTLTAEKLTPAGTGSLELLVLHAPPGTATAAALQQMAGAAQ